jgi:hypothetical protein
MHENVPQPRVVDRVACGGSGRLGHGHRARGRDRPSPCYGAARRHRVRPAAVHARADPGTVTDAQGHAHPRTDAHGHAHPGTDPGTVTDAGGHAHPGTDSGINTDAQALAHRGTDAHPVPDAGTIADGSTRRRPIGAQQRSEPRGVH